jgi:hypothetical protein
VVLGCWQDLKQELQGNQKNVVLSASASVTPEDIVEGDDKRY